jgi:hypothetical protein
MGKMHGVTDIKGENIQINILNRRGGLRSSFTLNGRCCGCTIIKNKTLREKHINLFTKPKQLHVSANAYPSSN